MWAAGGLCRQVPADAAASQLSKACSSTLPLLPDDGAQPPPGPLVKCAQHRRGLAEAEVAAPSYEVDGQLFDDLRQACPARAPRPFPNSRFEAGERLRRNPSPRLSPNREAEAQELANARLGNRALGLVDLELKPFGQEPFDAFHHPLACLPTAHIDVAVVGVANEAVAAFLQLLSSTSSIKFDNSGESGPPCGVPSSVGLTTPPSSTPVVKKPRTSFRRRLSVTRFATSPIRMSWFTRSKNFSRSISTT